jgi:hypothetical protein
MEIEMANREQRSNRETRKPKKDAAAKGKPASVQSTFAPPPGKGGKKK